MTPEMKSRIKTALKMAEEISDDEFYAAVETACTSYQSSAAAPEAPVPPVETGSDISTSVKALTEKMAAAEKRSLELESKLLAREVDVIATEAKHGDGVNGRALPDVVIATAREVAKVKGLKAARELLESYPLTVPIQTQGIAGSAGDVGPRDRAAFDAIVTAKQKEGLSYVAAVKAATQENKALADRAFVTIASTSISRT